MVLRKKPSPALMIAVAALVFALAGSAVGETASISLSRGEKKTIRKIAKKIANKRISARTAKIANRRITARAPNLNVKSAGTAASLSSLYWAVVNANGTLARASAGVLGSVDFAGTGAYVVQFNRNVSGCAYQASLGGQNPGNPNPGEASANPSSLSNDSLYVRTFTSAGASSDEPFTVLVTC